MRYEKLLQVTAIPQAGIAAPTLTDILMGVEGGSRTRVR